MFGVQVAISGQTAVIGAWGDDDRGNLAGATYLFSRAGSSWTEQTKLLASDGAADDKFGQSVAVDGQTVAIGTRAGSAYFFQLAGTSCSAGTVDGFSHGELADGASQAVSALLQTAPKRPPPVAAGTVSVATGALTCDSGYPATVAAACRWRSSSPTASKKT